MTMEAVTIEEFLIMAPTQHHLNKFKKIMDKKYSVKDLGAPIAYLGWNITCREKGSIHASQPTIIEKAIATAGLTEANKRPSPIPHRTEFDPIPTPPPLAQAEILTFRSILGDLLFLADCTRPDIAFTTARLARYTNKPT